jgi:membrane-bound ClpP family serine protease
MTMTLIYLLIILGLLLILVEIFIIPGTTVVGIGGGLMIAFAVWRAYAVFGARWGNITLVLTIIAVSVSLFIAFKSNSWKRIALNTNIDGRVNVIDENKLHVGEEGIAISRISPSGTARFNGELYEVHTNGEFIDQENGVVITRFIDNKIFVKHK